MNIKELRKYWEAEEHNARMKGWNFKHIEGRFYSDEDSLTWDLREVIHRYNCPSNRILDIDTGGGEFLLSLNHPFSLTSATEGYPPNVALCKEDLCKLGIDFHEMTDYAKMPFADGQFDLVINRHGNYNANEIFRILKPNGLFITQQVGECNDRELVERLLPNAKKRFTGHNLEKQSEIFRSAGFEILEQNEVYRPIKFYDTGALVWFAKVIEWEFVDFSVRKCFDNLISVEQEISQKGFISGRIHRFYFVARR